MSLSMKAALLDRDGPLVIDKSYMGRPDLIELSPGAIEGCKVLKEHGYALVMISNQSGVARGKFTLEDMQQVHNRVIELFREAEIEFEGAYYCPHGPDENCECRKPRPEMALKAARELNLDLSQSILLGDKLSEIEFGKNAGCLYSILVGDKGGEGYTREGQNQPDYNARTLKEAVAWVISK